ncbi:hypothetical protein M9Y10_024321 [Tritrichomonas musculus]|uniref:Uncharacterized protein n=1 Tax=Tritrichomonas musculus TaxID=1915356 RepID=A0ABR2HCP7_9EUKA
MINQICIENDLIISIACEQGFVVMSRDSFFDQPKLKEAVDFLIQNSVENEKSLFIEKMHQELNEVRQMSEKERSISESRRNKLNQKISDLRSSMAAMNEKYDKQEERLSGELEASKSSLRRVMHGLNQDEFAMIRK